MIYYTDSLEISQLIPSEEHLPFYFDSFSYFVIINVIVGVQICIVLGVILMVAAPIGALRGIILQAKDYKFYS